MEVHQLRYFVATAEAGSMTLGAKRCRVAQPSLSQQVRKLESLLGVELFDRLGRGVVLTDAGKALLPRARSILREVHEVEAHLRTDLDAGLGTLTVGAIPTMAPYLLPALIARLRSEHPGCEVIVREDLTDHLVEALADHELDVAIMSTPMEHEHIDLEVVGSEPMLVAAPRHHPLCALPEIGLADLRAEPAITLDDMHCLGEQVGDFCAANRLAQRITCSATQISTLLEFVRLGLGVTIIPEMAMRRERGDGLRYLAFKRSPPVREIALAWRTGRTRPRLAVRLAELLREHLTDAKR